MCLFFFSSRRRHTRWPRDWSSDVCSSDLNANVNLPLETVAVEYNNNEVDTTDMMNTVKKMGYDLRLAQDDKDKMDHKEQIGRASCRERVKNEEDGVGEKRKQEG